MTLQQNAAINLNANQIPAMERIIRDLISDATQRISLAHAWVSLR